MNRYPCGVVAAIGIAFCWAVSHAAFGQEEQHPEPLYFTGCCDASAGIALNERLFVVANDEDNVLRVYDRTREGAPLQSIELNAFLQVGTRQQEADLEAVARLGDTIYWITSHGRSRTGKARPNRQRLFATTFTVNGDAVEWAPVGRPYLRLLDDLLQDPKLRPFDLLNASRRAPKAEDALNIEGLAATPDGRLLIGFRNPAPEGKALIVPLLNPADVVRGRTAQFGDPILLDLGGLAIRSMMLHNGRYLIVAGSTNGKGRPQLFVWDGVGLAPDPLTHVRLRGMTPEGLLHFPGDGPDELMLISDDGTVKIDGVDCKDLPDADAKRFRVVAVTL